MKLTEFAEAVSMLSSVCEDGRVVCIEVYAAEKIAITIRDEDGVPQKYIVHAKKQFGTAAHNTTPR